MITYDKDVAYLEYEHDGFIRYLDGQIINSIYKCEGEFKTHYYQNTLIIIIKKNTLLN